MRRRRLGNEGPEISVVGFGAWEAGGTAWGANESDASVIDAMRSGLDAGIDWIDTAEVYGDGVSERLVGQAVEGRRDAVRIASKVAPSPKAAASAPSRSTRRATGASAASGPTGWTSTSCTGATTPGSPSRTPGER